jgi:hypothetical protein
MRPQDRLPILIGVTGKRFFDRRDPHRNAKLMAGFAERFRLLAKRLDNDYPATPKVLLSGGAEGADQVAAGIVLDHTDWSIVLMLPFQEDLYTQDLEKGSAARVFFETRLAAGPRILHKRMRPLHLAPFDDSGLEPADAKRVTEAMLNRCNASAFNPQARRDHFEQLGLWLARHSTLLVAGYIAEDAEEGSLGGTGRVMAFRRNGLPDATADAIMQRSSELQRSSPLQEPDGGHVLLIDPTQPAPYIALPPIQNLLRAGGQTSSLSLSTAAIYRRPAALHAAAAHDHLHDALRIPRRFEAFHRAHSRGGETTAPTSDDRHPAAYLESIRTGQLRDDNDDAGEKARAALRQIVLLFLLGAGLYELHVEFLPRSHMLVLFYATMLLGAFLRAWSARRALYQVKFEDYRGLREMMRVQIGWWNAGIARQVDRIHLRSVDSDLRHVREAAAAITTWAILRCRALPTTDPTTLDHAADASRWPKEQLGYFTKALREQHAAKAVAEQFFEVAFAAFLGMLTLMACVMGALQTRDGEGWLERFAPAAFIVLPACAVLVLGGLLQLTTGASRLRRTANAWPPVAAYIAAGGLCCWLGAILPWPAGGGFGAILLVAALVVMALTGVPTSSKYLVVPELGLAAKLGIAASVVAFAMLLAVAMAAALPGAPAENFRSTILMSSVLLLTSAGLIRFYTDRRNHSAQANQYADMRRAFARAVDIMAHGALTPRQLQVLLIELGELALDENEAWLKAHRERPPGTP